MSVHPDTAFVPLLRNELAPAEHARVRAHIAACPACARALEETRLVLARMGASLPAPPDVHWPAYRAQLRDRLDAHRPARAGWRRFARPLPLAVSAAAAALLIVVAAQTDLRPGASASDVEDLEIIRQLDRLPVREG
jgi:anti-sigma factor RsiW